MESILRKLDLREEEYGAGIGSPMKCEGPLLTSFSPVNGKPIGKIRCASLNDYETVINSATQAFVEWKRVPAPKRGDIVRQIGMALRRRKQELGALISLEVGKIRAEGEGEVQEMIDIIVSTVQSVRHISRELRPSMLDKQGLGATMRWYVEQFQERSGICCHAVITIDDVAMENDHTIAVYRILQEALTNILRHSDADEVTLQVLVEDKHLVMAIRDNGRGIDHN
ncbi:MAG: aldehyde dehydrogenase family protein, partial [Desulfobacterales bacterium]